ncbi:MAG: hypothetical protein KDF63_16885, partial [Rhodoferax sp.]|nr:hypothetical protein [Rhodoferax sp.]
MSPAVGLRRRLLLYLRSRVPTALGRQSHLSSTVQCHRGVREAGSGPAGALPASPRGASEYIRNEERPNAADDFYGCQTAGMNKPPSMQSRAAPPQP